MTADPGNIYVNYSQIDNVLEELQGANQKIQQVLTDLNDQISPLRSTWSGASEGEYIQVQNRWNYDLSQMSNLLTQYGSVLSEMSINYGTTDNNLAAQWASIN